MIFPTDEILSEFDLHWQYPDVTEYIFYTQEKANPHFIGLPWDQIDFDVDLLQKYIDINKEYYTCCVDYQKFIMYFKKLNITTVYTPRKIYGQNTIDNIVLKPCSVYAINIEQEIINTSFKNVDFINKPRLFLYSFMEGLDKNYKSKIVLDLFNLPRNNESMLIIKKTYPDNLQNKDKNYIQYINQNFLHDTVVYNHLLLESRFSLCASAKSRFWECLAVGTIPVLLSDACELPPHPLWNDTIVRILEKEYTCIKKILEQIPKTQELQMRRNCITIYNFFKNNYTGHWITKETTMSKLPIQLTLQNTNEQIKVLPTNVNLPYPQEIQNENEIVQVHQPAKRQPTKPKEPKYPRSTIPIQKQIFYQNKNNKVKEYKSIVIKRGVKKTLSVSDDEETKN